ncbi:SH2 domain-containing protein 1B [Sigmodon hispidus]
MDLPYYHGQLTKRECETLLLKEGVDGNFLIRDSESLPGALCLCVSFKKFVYTYRIFREKHGYYKIQKGQTVICFKKPKTVEGAPKQIFPNLKELISKFEKPDQGLVVHLSNPVTRTRAMVEPNVYGKSSDKGSEGTLSPTATHGLLCSQWKLMTYSRALL